MKIQALTALLFVTLASYGQGKTIAEINTVDEAKMFIENNPKLDGEIIELNSGIDSSEIARQIFANKNGAPQTIDRKTYKVIESKPSFLLRASYIFLDGSKFSLSQIDSLRKVIISKYNNGALFTVLAKEYTMDGSTNCDIGWAAEGMLVSEFSMAVKEHRTGEIFTVDVPSKKWYHVALKTFDEREVKIYSILRIKNNS